MQFWLLNQMKCFVLEVVGCSSVRVEPLILANAIEQILRNKKTLYYSRAFYVTQRFVIVLTRDRNLSLF